jgi:hypothetical protein
MVLRPDRLTTERRQIRPNVTLCCAPSWFLPPLIALPEPTVMCGFLPQSVIDPLPIAPALLEFLENGKAPILFINHHGPIDHQLARQACRQLGRRGVFIGENLPRSDDRFFCCEHAPLI